MRLAAAVPCSAGAPRTACSLHDACLALHTRTAPRPCAQSQVVGIRLGRYDQLYRVGEAAESLYIVAEGRMGMYDHKSRDKEDREREKEGEAGRAADSPIIMCAM